MFIQRDENNKIICAWENKQYANQEQIDESHADFQEFLLIPKISQIRSMRNRKLDEIDLKFCNAQKWEAMTQAEKDSWSAIKAALVSITDKDGSGNYLKINVNNADSFLNDAPNVWPY
jgi:hypothetical protein